MFSKIAGDVLIGKIKLIRNPFVWKSVLLLEKLISE